MQIKRGLELRCGSFLLCCAPSRRNSSSTCVLGRGTGRGVFPRKQLITDNVMLHELLLEWVYANYNNDNNINLILLKYSQIMPPWFKSNRAIIRVTFTEPRTQHGEFLEAMIRNLLPGTLPQGNYSYSFSQTHTWYMFCGVGIGCWLV